MNMTAKTGHLWRNWIISLKKTEVMNNMILSTFDKHKPLKKANPRGISTSYVTDTVNKTYDWVKPKSIQERPIPLLN